MNENIKEDSCSKINDLIYCLANISLYKIYYYYKDLFKREYIYRSLINSALNEVAETLYTLFCIPFFENDFFISGVFVSTDEYTFFKNALVSFINSFKFNQSRKTSNAIYLLSKSWNLLIKLIQSDICNLPKDNIYLSEIYTIIDSSIELLGIPNELILNPKTDIPYWNNCENINNSSLIINLFNKMVSSSNRMKSFIFDHYLIKFYENGYSLFVMDLKDKNSDKLSLLGLYKTIPEAIAVIKKKENYTSM